MGSVVPLDGTKSTKQMICMYIAALGLCATLVSSSPSLGHSHQQRNAVLHSSDVAQAPGSMPDVSSRQKTDNGDFRLRRRQNLGGTGSGGNLPIGPDIPTDVMNGDTYKLGDLIGRCMCDAMLEVNICSSY